jgi:two-component system sensor histidine kinase/response regulator
VVEELDLDGSALDWLEHLGGTRFLGQMIDLFLEHALDQIKTAQSAHREGNQRRVKDALHSLKSSAGNVGARVVQQIAASVEQDGAARDQAWIASRLTELEMAYGRVAVLLRQRKETLEP